MNHHYLFSRSSPVLSWRLDPEESLSDWKISVVSSTDLEQNDSQYLDRYDVSTKRAEESSRSKYTEVSPVKNDLALTRIYFVHRAQLAVGPRKSEFFCNLFRREQSKLHVDSESIHSSSGKSRNYTKIELMPSAASCFPIMLDYMYSNESEPLAITTESAVALRQLASTFGIRSMFKETTLFIKNDLTPQSAPIYLLDAVKFKNRKLKESAKEMIACNFLLVKFSSFVQIPTELMKEIVRSDKLHIDSREKLSSRIAAYCRCREDELDLTILNCLTNASIFTTVDDAESLYFLHLLFELKGKECNANIESMNLHQLCMLKVPKVLNSLQTLRSLSSESLDKSAGRKQKKDLELYSNLPAEIKVHLLEKSFELNQAPTPEIYLKSEPAFNIDRKAKKQVDKLQNEVNQLKISYEKKLNYYQRMLDAKVQELKQYSECDSETNWPNDGFTH